MADKSFIEWTNSTCNDTTGCDKISPGCRNCYAERYARLVARLKNMGVKKYSECFKLTLHPDVLDYRLSSIRILFLNLLAKSLSSPS
jgi:protein gp37